jgi:hypothetical protein
MALDTWPSGNWDQSRNERICVEHTVEWLSAYTHHYGTRSDSTKRDTIVAKSLDLLQNILPEINNRKPPWMELSSVEEDTLPSYEQRVLIPGHLESH